MPRLASTTGLIAARTRPVRRPKQKKIELRGVSVPAPFTLRPFAGLFNPYPYGCSVLCNHPADNEAKEVVRKAKDTWATEGKTTLLPAELELLRAGLRLAADSDQEAPAVPEELFRRYTETDSRPLSPASPEPAAKEPDGDAKERATLVLDLRASSHEIQENETTLSWRALTLEPIPSSRRSEATVSGGATSRRKPQLSSRHRSATVVSSSPVRSVPVVEVSDAASTRSAPTNLMTTPDDEDDDESSSPDEAAPMRRRGKLRRKKRKRRGSIYGQQTEVRELPDPLETQVSQVDEGSRRDSLCTRLEDTKQASLDKTTLPTIKPDVPPSFLPPEIIKELSRELDRETVECEFNPKRRYALEEVLRVTGEVPISRGPRQTTPGPILPQTEPRLFYRGSARFELLDSLSLVGLTPLDYLRRHVFVSETRKAMFNRSFNKYREETSEGPRFMRRDNLLEALHDVLGRPIGPEEAAFLRETVGELPDCLDFRTWCGVCALAERTLPELPPRERDQPPWLERADFEMLERRLKGVSVDEKLERMLWIVKER